MDQKGQIYSKWYTTVSKDQHFVCSFALDNSCRQLRITSVTADCNSGNCFNNIKMCIVTSQTNSLSKARCPTVHFLWYFLYSVCPKYNFCQTASTNAFRALKWKQCTGIHTSTDVLYTAEHMSRYVHRFEQQPSALPFVSPSGSQWMSWDKAVLTVQRWLKESHSSNVNHQYWEINNLNNTLTLYILSFIHIFHVINYYNYI